MLRVTALEKQHMNQRKPLAERHPELLRLERNCGEERAYPEQNNPRSQANKAFIRSLSQLEQTLVGDEAVDPQASMPQDLPMTSGWSETIVPTELDDLAEAVADIEAYIQEQHPASN
jgi:hypothetical protein